MTPDKHREIRSGDIQDQFAFITFVLIDRRTLGIKEGKNGTQNRDGDICNRIQIIVTQLLAILITTRDVGVFADDFRLLRLDLISYFFTHGTLH